MFLCLIFFSASTSFGQGIKQTFTKENFPSENYDVTYKTFEFKKLKLEFISVKLKTDTNSVRKTYLNIYQDKNLLDQESLESEWSNGVYGLPSTQPLDNYFMFIFYGDRNGKINLVDSSGFLKTFPGYYWAISLDKKLIYTKANFSNAESAVSKFQTDNGMIIQKKWVSGIQGEPWQDSSALEYKGFEVKLFK